MTTASTTGKTARFVSLDVFRGATIFLMILVNTAGAGAAAYPLLVHAKWIGFTAADLVFPSFLFAMGTAMSFALRKPMPAGTYVRHLLRRGAIIFALGFLMYWFPFVAQGENGWHFIPFAQTRVPGVLQRLALCYVIAGLLARWLDWRGLLAACVAILLAYWIILLVWSLPGQAFEKYGTAGTRLDMFLFSPGHLYKKDGGFDPEGFLGTLPAVVNVIGGYLAGFAILKFGDLRRLLVRMASAGIVLALAGLAWSPWFPIAKKLWSSSFVLLTLGLDLVLLALVVWIFDVAKVTRGQRFFSIMGRNPLAIYLFSELFVIVLNMIRVPGYGGLYEWFGIAVCQSLFPGPLGSLLTTFLYTMLCWAVGWWLDRKGLFLRA